LASQDQKIALPLLMALLKSNIRFDSITKTKTVEGILSSLDQGGINAHLEYLLSVFVQPEQVGEGKAEGVRIWVVEQIYLFIRTSKVKKEKEWVQKSLTFFLQHGCFECVEESVSAQAREKLVGSLGYLGKEWALFTFETYQQMKKDQKPLIESDTDALAASETLIERINQKIKMTVEEKQLEELNALQTVVVIVGVLIAIQGEHAELVSELEQCFETMFPDKIKKRKLEEDVEPVAVLCDILISFLSKPSVLLRGIALQVFKTFSGKVSGSVIDLFFDVLNAGNDSELFDENDSDGEDFDVQKEQIEMENDEIENAEVVDEELKRKLQEALENDEDEDVEELEDLDDDDMAAFDSKLAEIFGHRKQMSKLKKGIPV
jgi:DNA polymerase phi